MDENATAMSEFGVMDYVSVGWTLLFSVAIGLYYSCKGVNSDGHLSANNPSVLPIATSMLVTYCSAIAILGNPADVYARGSQILMTAIVHCITTPISILMFAVVLYKMRLASVFEYLELRFESVAVRCFASIIYIIQTLLLNSVVLYAPAIALETIIGLPIWISIVTIGFVATLPSIGGLQAVVWADCFQFLTIAFCLGTIVVRGVLASGGIHKTYEVALENGRLLLFDFRFDPFMKVNFWNLLIGYGFHTMLTSGINPPQVQRYCSLPTFGRAVAAILLTIPLKIFTVGLMVLAGIVVFTTYAGCSPLLLGHIKGIDYIIPYFVQDKLSSIPGQIGSLTSCIFAAVLSTISSTLNTLAAVSWRDFFSKLKCFKKISDQAQAHFLKFLAIFYGFVSVGMAFGASRMSTNFVYAGFAVAGACSGPLGGLFLCAIFLPKVNKYGAISGMLVGFSSMMFVAFEGFILQSGRVIEGDLGFSVDMSQCPNGTDFSNFNNSTQSSNPEWGWPTKIYTISILWYSICGSLITVLVAAIVSTCFGGSTGKVPRKYVHPIVYWCGGVEAENKRTKGNEMEWIGFPPEWDDSPSTDL